MEAADAEARSKMEALSKRDFGIDGDAGTLAMMNSSSSGGMGIFGASNGGESRQQRTPPDDYVCNACGHPGHWIADCPARRGARQNNVERTQRNPQNNANRFDNTSDDRRLEHNGYTDNRSMDGRHVERGNKGAAGGRKPPPNYICNRCKKPGHWYVFVFLCVSLSFQIYCFIKNGELTTNICIF